MAAASQHKPALITSARFAKTLDTDARRTRYLWTMAARVACFLIGVVTPLPWNFAFFLAAAVLPAVAVLLANAIDQRQPPVPEAAPAGSHPALNRPGTVGGSVEEAETDR